MNVDQKGNQQESCNDSSNDEENSVDGKSSHHATFQLLPLAEFWRKYTFREADLIYESSNSNIYSGYTVDSLSSVVIKITAEDDDASPCPKEVYYHKRAAQNNKGVVQILDWYVGKGIVAIVMERFESFVNMEDCIDQHEITSQQAMYIISNLMRTIQKCHQNGVYHQDIKLTNILINPDTLETKLIDFGNSTTVQEGKQKILLGTYPPPEWRDKGEYDGGRSDAWALGCLIYLLLTEDYELIYQLDHLNMKFEILTDDFMGRLDGVPSCFKSLLRQLFCKDETKRLDLASMVIPSWRS